MNHTEVNFSSGGTFRNKIFDFKIAFQVYLPFSAQKCNSCCSLPLYYTTIRTFFLGQAASCPEMQKAKIYNHNNINIDILLFSLKDMMLTINSM